MLFFVLCCAYQLSRMLMSFPYLGGTFMQTAYIDVCDDTDYAFRAKSLCNKAADANVAAVTTAGIYPGVSNGPTNFYRSISYS